jgi:hypothetical protein
MTYGDAPACHEAPNAAMKLPGELLIAAAWLPPLSSSLASSRER